MHVTVLGPEAIGFLGIKPNGTYLDATGGGGGHAELILEKLSERGRLLIADRDPSAVNALCGRFSGDSRCCVLRTQFSGLFEIMKSKQWLPLDGLLADLGLSSMQLDDPERDFSFRSKAGLDMRMDPDFGHGLSELLETVDEAELADIIFQFGEERQSRKMARALHWAHRKGELHTADELGKLAEKTIGSGYRGRKIHPATKTFQALRIWVNDEPHELSALMNQLPQLMAARGRAVMISFHSLEDRCVKKKFLSLKSEGWKILTKKPVIAGEMERRENPRSRSAKLRAIEKGEETCRES